VEQLVGDEWEIDKFNRAFEAIK